MTIRLNAPRPSSASSAERGETLVEVMVTVILLGTAIASILGGMLTVTQVASVTQNRSRANTVAQNYAEQLKQAVSLGLETTQQAPGYIPCGKKWDDPNPALRYPEFQPYYDNTIFTGYNARIMAVEYLATTSSSGPTWTSSCTRVCILSGCDLTKAAETRDSGVQQLYIEVTSPTGDRQARESVVLVKRDQRCPPSFENLDRGPC